MIKKNGAKSEQTTGKERGKKDKKTQFQKGNIGRKSDKSKLLPIIKYLESKLPDLPEPLLERWAKLFLSKKDSEFLSAIKVVLGIEQIEQGNIVLPDHLQRILAQGEGEPMPEKPFKDTSQYGKA